MVLGLKFIVVEPGKAIPRSFRAGCVLHEDNWDDWFTFETTYFLTFRDHTRTDHSIGSVKIGQIGMPSGRRPALPKEFSDLEDEFFSLGQDVSYYEHLNQLGASLRSKVLSVLNDIAADSELFQRVLNENVTRRSLMRSVPKMVVSQQFHRIAHGGASLTEYKFRYLLPSGKPRCRETTSLDFEVEPQSYPPTNIHAIIGRNGVGKTRMLSLMAKSVIDPEENGHKHGTFEDLDDFSEESLFSYVVSVTFSAFDPFDPPTEQDQSDFHTRYSYVGLKRPSNAGPHKGKPKSPDMLTKEFVDGLRLCSKGARKKRWKEAVSALESDPVFHAVDANQLVANDELDEAVATSLFSKLSSGHKIVLLTLTRLVETVQEKTLVLLDEPEAHLHPPLLSAFIRALSDLLVNRNGVAIIATHSPVILQEVPRNCVWKIQRSGFEVRVDRPDSETFGENVGVLTREVFGLELTQSGFHRLIAEQVDKGKDYEGVVRVFGGKLGGEGRAIARALISSRDNHANL